MKFLWRTTELQFLRETVMQKHSPQIRQTGRRISKAFFVTFTFFCSDVRRFTFIGLHPIIIAVWVFSTETRALFNVADATLPYSGDVVLMTDVLGGGADTMSCHDGWGDADFLLGERLENKLGTNCWQAKRWQNPLWTSWTYMITFFCCCEGSAADWVCTSSDLKSSNQIDFTSCPFIHSSIRSQWGHESIPSCGSKHTAANDKLVVQAAFNHVAAWLKVLLVSRTSALTVRG